MTILSLFFVPLTHSPFVWGCARGEPKLKQAWSEPGSKLAPVLGEQGPTAYGPHCPRNACLGRRNCKWLRVKSPSLRDKRCVRATAGLWEVALPEPLGPQQTPTSRPLRPLCCYSAFTVHPKTLPDSLHVLDVGIGPEHGCWQGPRGDWSCWGAQGGSWSRWASDRARNTGPGTESWWWMVSDARSSKT